MRPDFRNLRTRLPFIDAARGLAAAAVVLFHSLGAFPASSLHPALGFVSNATSLGWLGVHVFFTLSGWCITERLASARARGESPITFLIDRGLRIYPAYWAALALAILLRLAASPFNQTDPISSIPASSWAWFGDLGLLHIAIGTPVYLLVSWSLFYELSYYLLAALTLSRFTIGPGRFPWLLNIGAALCFVPLLGPLAAPLKALGNWMDFFLGVLAWYAARRTFGWSLYSALTVMGTATVLLFNHHLLGIGPLVSGSVAILLWLTSRHSRWADALSPAPLLSLGAISYSLYLIHVPILSPLMNLAARLLPTTSYGFVLAWFMAVVTAFVAAFGFNRLIESRCEKWRRRLVSRETSS